eukprot:scaffold1554_cov401-Prasinococcus_capsulatus_cf.AAC.28
MLQEARAWRKASNSERVCPVRSAASRSSEALHLLEAVASLGTSAPAFRLHGAPFMGYRAPGRCRGRAPPQVADRAPLAPTTPECPCLSTLAVRTRKPPPAGVAISRGWAGGEGFRHRGPACEGVVSFSLTALQATTMGAATDAAAPLRDGASGATMMRLRATMMRGTRALESAGGGSDLPHGRTRARGNHAGGRDR